MSDDPYSLVHRFDLRGISTARWIGITVAVAVAAMVVLIGAVLAPQHRPAGGAAPAPGGPAAGSTSRGSADPTLLGLDDPRRVPGGAAATTALRGTRSPGGTSATGRPGGVTGTGVGAGGTGGSGAGGGGRTAPVAATCTPGLVGQLLSLVLGGPGC